MDFIPVSFVLSGFTAAHFGVSDWDGIFGHTWRELDSVSEAAILIVNHGLDT